MDKAQEKIAREITQRYYNSGNMLNEMRLASSPEEQLINAHKLGMKFPKELGYRKPLDRPELREEIKAEYVRFNHKLIPIIARLNDTGEFAEIEVAEEEFFSQILALIPDIPKDKPPLLEVHDCHQVDNPFDYNMGAQAQWDIWNEAIYGGE